MDTEALPVPLPAAIRDSAPPVAAIKAVEAAMLVAAEAIKVNVQPVADIGGSGGEPVVAQVVAQAMAQVVATGAAPLGGGYQGQRPAGGSGYQGQRPTSGGYQGGGGGYQGQRPSRVGWANGARSRADIKAPGLDGRPSGRAAGQAVQEDRAAPQVDLALRLWEQTRRLPQSASLIRQKKPAYQRKEENPGTEALSATQEGRCSQG
ncbi:hypothetical protein MASR2M48_27960 [Spirochaetota bacterium]